MKHAFILTKSNPDRHEALAGFDHPEGRYGSYLQVPQLDLERLGSYVDPAPPEPDPEEAQSLPESLLLPIERALAVKHEKGVDPDASLAVKRTAYLKARLEAWGPAPNATDKRRGHARQAAHLAFSWGPPLDAAKALFASLALPADALDDVYAAGSVFFDWAANDGEILADEKRLADEMREAERLAAEAEAREAERTRLVTKRLADIPSVARSCGAVFVQLEPQTHKAPIALDLVSGFGPKYPSVTTRLGTHPGVLIDSFGLSVPAGQEAGSPLLGWLIVSLCDATVTGTARSLNELGGMLASSATLDRIRSTRPPVDREPLTAFKTGTDPSTAANERAFEQAAARLISLALKPFHASPFEEMPNAVARRMVASEARARLLHPDRAVAIVSRLVAAEWAAKGVTVQGPSRTETTQDGHGRHARPITRPVPREQLPAPLPVEWQEAALFELFAQVYGGEGAEHSPGELWQEAPAHVANRELAKAPEVDPWRDAISAFCAGKERFVMGELEGAMREAGALGETTQPTERPRIFRILLSLGWARKQRMSDGRRSWFWVRDKQQ